MSAFKALFPNPLARSRVELARKISKIKARRESGALKARVRRDETASAQLARSAACEVTQHRLALASLSASSL